MLTAPHKKTNASNNARCRDPLITKAASLIRSEAAVGVSIGEVAGSAVRSIRRFDRSEVTYGVEPGKTIA
jgi:hypothetical protein